MNTILQTPPRLHPSLVMAVQHGSRDIPMSAKFDYSSLLGTPPAASPAQQR